MLILLRFGALLAQLPDNDFLFIIILSLQIDCGVYSVKEKSIHENKKPFTF